MASRVTIYAPTDTPPIAFAVHEITAALLDRGRAVDSKPVTAFEPQSGTAQIVLTTAPPGEDPIEPEGYVGEYVADDTYRIVGGEPVGAMYGGIDVAEQIEIRGHEGLVERTVSPAIERRGLKMNIPLDGRTPAFDDAGHAAFHNYRVMWESGFWAQFFDEMARSRFNTLTLWNKHPFPSLISVPEYPDVALDDVYVPQFPNRSDISPCRRTGPEVPVEPALSLSMEEKIEYWRSVLRRAADRSIDVYLITWNVCVDGTARKYGITAAQDNETTIEYLRASVRELVLTYPELSGIGTTAGEAMEDRDDEFDREPWLWSTYGRGVLDAKEQAPELTVPFIHRVWQSDLERIVEEFVSPYPDPLTFSFKYARAHCYSSPNPPFADELIDALREHDINCWWNVRNDDQFCFRWGDPEYVADFVEHFPGDVTAGYHFGSDGYVWGRTFTELGAVEPQLELEKHWYAHRSWGMAGYDPDRSASYYRDRIATRFPEAIAGDLYDGWQAASRIIPRVNQIHWKDWDFQWAPEGCFGHEGFHSVESFASGCPMPGSGVQSIADYVTGTDAADTTPVAVADALDRDATEALELVSGCIRDPVGATSRELASTILDIRALAWLGRYYATKIRGAVALAEYESTGNSASQRAAVDALEAGLRHWEAYARLASQQYRPQLLSRPGWLNWWAMAAAVEADVRIAKSAAE